MFITDLKPLYLIDVGNLMIENAIEYSFNSMERSIIDLLKKKTLHIDMNQLLFQSLRK